MQPVLRLIPLLIITFSICGCATEQEKKIVGTWDMYCSEDELRDSLNTLKADEALRVKRKFTADNESIEIFEDNKKKYSSLSPGAWKIDGNKLSVSMYTYTMYNAEVFDIVQITDTTLTLAKGQEFYIWRRDKDDKWERFGLGDNND